VVLAEETREQILEVLDVFAHPELARELGAEPPAGILLYGPPGTGKTTIARAIASQVSASFYEQSAAGLLSKWVGESEQRVAKLFARARENRPTIIFIDEVDALLARRNTDSSSRWEERVISQFLHELDGLRSGDGVLLVGATNRPDVIDEAVVGRRLTPIEVGLPDSISRLHLLKLLCTDMKLDKAIDLRQLAAETEGMSGADLKRLCHTAGAKAVRRTANAPTKSRGKAVKMEDFEASLDSLRDHSSMVEV
jgi:transitional endoplasmic reticulum ATPase